MPGAVVGGAGAQVPAIDVPADDHDLVGLLGAGNLGDRVVDLDLAVAEGVLQVDLDLDRPALEQPPDQAVRLGGEERLGDLGRGEVGRGAGHVDQAVLLVRVAEHPGDPFGDQELLELRAELAHAACSRGSAAASRRPGWSAAAWARAGPRPRRAGPRPP